MIYVETAIVFVKTTILLLGGSVAYIAYKAYLRTGISALRELSVGFGVITLGALLGGVAHQILAVSLEIGLLINSILVAIGFGIILYSLYSQE